MDLHKNKPNRQTRMHIGDTIVSLMNHKELSKITVSEIAQKAGISRMTFYHYYETKENVLTDYLAEMISSFIEAREEKGINKRLHSFEHLNFALIFFSDYKQFMLQLYNNGCYHILIQGVNEFLYSQYGKEYERAPYHLYFYTGALLNVFLEWLKNGQEESSEDLARLILHSLD